MQSLMQAPEEKKLIIKNPDLRDVTMDYVVEDLIEGIRATVVKYHENNSQLFRQEAYFRIKASSRSSNEWVYHLSMSGVPRSASMKHDSVTNVLTVELKNRYMLRHNNLVQDPQTAQTIVVALLSSDGLKNLEASTIQCNNMAHLRDTITNWVAPKIKDSRLPRAAATVFFTQDRISFSANQSLVLAQKIINVVDNPHNAGAVVVLEKGTVEIPDKEKSSVYKRAIALYNHYGDIYLLSNAAGQGLVVRDKELKAFKSVD